MYQAVQVGHILTCQLDFTSSWQKKTFQVLVDLMKPLRRPNDGPLLPPWVQHDKDLEMKSYFKWNFIYKSHILQCRRSLDNMLGLHKCNETADSMTDKTL